MRRAEGPNLSCPSVLLPKGDGGRGGREEATEEEPGEPEQLQRGAQGGDSRLSVYVSPPRTLSRLSAGSGTISCNCRLRYIVLNGELPNWHVGNMAELTNITKQNV